MELTEKQLKVKGLKVGMYVSRLDRPWRDTDFPLQGLYIRGQADIDHIAEYCHSVFIDEARSRTCIDCEQFNGTVGAPEPLTKAQSAQDLTKNIQNPIRTSPPQDSSKPKAVNPKKSPNYIDPISWKNRHCIEKYAVSSKLEQELRQVTPLVALFEHHIETLHSKLLARQNLNIEPLVECTADLIESLVRNPDALAWVCEIMVARKPVMLHMIRLTVWAGIVGRQLGLNRFSMVHLSMALMMTGVGKSFMSDKTLRHHNVYQHSEEYEGHLDEAKYYLNQAHFSCKDILTTIENYCERHNGTGYPAKKQGGQIPFLARVAGLIDTYEYMVHPFNNGSVSPANAIVRLNKLQGLLFDGPLVEAFIRAMGIYPTGSVVEVNNGMVGIVVSNSYEKRIQAQVIPLIRPDGSHVESFTVEDLYIKSHQGLGAKDLVIKRGLSVDQAPQHLVYAAHQHIFEPKKGFFSKFFD